MRSLLAVPVVCVLFACGAEPKAPTSAPPGATAPTTANAPSTAPGAAPVATNDKMRAQALERIAMIARNVVSSWEREALDSDGKGPHHALCPSAKPVPTELDRGKAVEVPDEVWMKDPGWNCLRFLPSEPHWFQYEARRVDDAHVQVVARRHDVELEINVLRASPKGDWTIGKVAERAR